MADSQTEQEASLVSDRVKKVGSHSSSGHRTFPTFVGIGSMRCGSTWLYRVLRCHSDIWLSDRKEIDFFFMRRMLQHDLRWYERHFAPEHGSVPKTIRGEISPLYAR